MGKIKICRNEVYKINVQYPPFSETRNDSLRTKLGDLFKRYRRNDLSHAAEVQGSSFAIRLRILEVHLQKQFPCSESVRIERPPYCMHHNGQRYGH